MNESFEVNEVWVTGDEYDLVIHCHAKRHRKDWELHIYKTADQYMLVAGILKLSGVNSKIGSALRNHQKEVEA